MKKPTRLHYSYKKKNWNLNQEEQNKPNRPTKPQTIETNKTIALWKKRAGSLDI